MLVLSRKLGERIVIGENIVVTVVGMSGDRIRLGISAPAGVPIHREEIFRRLQEQESSTVLANREDSPYVSRCA